MTQWEKIYIFNSHLFLFQVDSNEWKSVDHPEWPSKAIVALIEWLPHLTKVIMPNILRQKLLNANKGSINIGSSVLPTMDETDIEHLVQWSDMLVYDYLTGNYDRVSSMQVRWKKFQKYLNKNSPKTGYRLHSKFKWEAKSPGYRQLGN